MSKIFVGFCIWGAEEESWFFPADKKLKMLKRGSKQNERLCSWTLPGVTVWLVALCSCSLSFTKFRPTDGGGDVFYLETAFLWVQPAGMFVLGGHMKNISAHVWSLHVFTSSPAGISSKVLLISGHSSSSAFCFVFSIQYLRHGAKLALDLTGTDALWMDLFTNLDFCPQTAKSLVILWRLWF